MMTSFILLWSAWLATGLGWTSGSGAAPQPKVLIAAAADLRYAMDSLVTAYKQQHPGSDVEVIYGSSGNFYEQILNGAPFDLFFSADLDYVERLKTAGKLSGSIIPYGRGKLVLWSLHLDPTAKGIQTLTNPGIEKIAIANPAHAPYGKRAVEVLQHYGLYDQLKDKLVMGENISQTAQFASTGAADIGLIALSLALSPALQKTGGKYWLIPEDSHSPLEQGYALLAHSTGNGEVPVFSSYIQSSAAKAVLAHFGFQ
jgi:molybdate transport system substrate-binding protein